MFHALIRAAAASLALPLFIVFLIYATSSWQTALILLGVAAYVIGMIWTPKPPAQPTSLDDPEEYLE